MTDSPKPSPTADLMDRVRWPHVALVLGILAITVVAMVLAPDPTTALLSGLLGGGGMMGTVLRGGVLRESAPPPPPPIAPRRNPRREGFIDVDLMAIIVGGAVAVWGAAHWLAEVMS